MDVLVTDSLFYEVIFLIAGFFGTFLGISVIIIVITQSPESMKSYKRFIINFTLFDMLFAFTMGVLVKPDPLFPFTGAVINGLFKYLGEQGAVISDVAIVNTAGYAVSTQCACIIYRFAVLQPNPKFLDFVLSWIEVAIGPGRAEFCGPA
uniref:G_PROTEIN_RECEP_F1_2 domain-containing protein n=2 Tax=Bursaphelenchus xylophilus TaxID=6326 RepID=A0A1I7SNA1_BURXY